ncbi:protein inhibitor of activated STAT [Penaeus vannamei]|uniref:Protein inhibitor of activated STAT n=1 Tax=Penaeus vannamei TaxID=6689 RepID=A0A423TFN7_PENVA|nr:protein inhibitor of activated STAT [Penaeus vannamei]
MTTLILPLQALHDQIQHNTTPCTSKHPPPAQQAQEKQQLRREGTKSNDSWCVGEVDPGKRLVFRKSLSCSLNGTGGLLTPAGGGSSGTTFSPPSSGSVSPQVICLDSPASSPSPPLRRPNQGPSPLPAGISVTPVVSTPAVTSSSTSFASGHSDVRQVINVTSRSTPPVTASSNSSSSSSPVPHATITPVPSTTSSSATISTPSTNASTGQATAGVLWGSRRSWSTSEPHSRGRCSRDLLFMGLGTATTILSTRRDLSSERNALSVR